MGKIVTFELSALPSPNVGTLPKHTTDELDGYIAVVTGGKAAGDGVSYSDKKAAQSAAASIKRGLKKYAPEISVAMRVWEAKGSWFFALRPFTPTVKGE